MSDTSTISSAVSEIDSDPRSSTIKPAHISVKLVKAFVQPDGSHGNGAGVVLLPGLPHTEPKNGSIATQEPGTSNHLFPPSGECLKIAKRVGLPETSFVFFPQKNETFCENRTVLDDEGGQKDNDFIVDKPKERADFHVKWFTPECEVDLCGHATVALAGYIHSMMKEKANSNVGVNCDAGNRQPNGYFWKMQCKAGLLGIEVVETTYKRIAAADHPGIKHARTRESNQTNKYITDSLPRVVMEQAMPKFCGIVDCNEITKSLNIDVESDLAVTVTQGISEEQNRVFPFPDCEIVSTGGRDLMVPVRSTVLSAMNILEDSNPNHGGNITSDDSKRQQLCRSIDIVSKRYNIVGYHMFGVEDSLFRSNRYSEGEDPAVTLRASTRIETNIEAIEGQNIDFNRPISLNELIRIFQIANERGTSGEESCLEAVGIDPKVGQDSAVANAKTSQYDYNDRATSIAAVSAARKSRIILVTGVRNFAPAVGILEEPATGSANGALACYFVKHLFLGALCGSNSTSFSSNVENGRNCISLSSPVIFRFCMEQGRDMGEPCLIDAEIEVANGKIRAVKVGGLVSVTGDSLDLDLTSI